MLRRDLFFWMSISLGVLALTAYLRASAPGRHHRGDVTRVGAIANDPDSVDARVDQEFRKHWEQLGLQPAPTADSLQVCRRISLALTGTLPSLEEIRQLQQVPEQQRVAWWTEHVLADRRYADYMAERFTRVLVGVEEGPFIIYRRHRFNYWLSDQLHDNVPYDQIVRRLITGTGLWTDAPEVNFLTVTAGGDTNPHPDEERLAGRTTRAFLGVRLDCVQCHDDNLGGPWLQSDFHQLAAFFSEARSSFFGITDKHRDYKTQYLHADDDEVVPPEVPFSESIPHQDGNRREQLAEWITHPENQAFGRAIVNRAWALLLNRPLVDPVDNIPLSPPYPPGLETLAADFQQTGCDLKQLWRNLIATEVFQRDSQAPFELTPEHDAQWAAFPVTRLRPEQVAGALVQSSQLKTIDANSHIITRLTRQTQINEFVKRFGDMGEDEFANQSGTIPQRLLMLNGQLVHERTKDDFVTNAATRIAALCHDDEAAINAAYLTILTRNPTTEELNYFLEQFAANKSPGSRKLEDLCWVLLNSAEFAWNH